MMTPDEIAVRADAVAALRDLVAAHERAATISNASLYYTGHSMRDAYRDEVDCIRTNLMLMYGQKIDAAAIALRQLNVDPSSITGIAYP